MPSLRYVEASGAVRCRPLYKRITTIGSSEECDVRLPADPKIAPGHVQLLFDGAEFTASALERSFPLFIQGKRKSKQVLEHGDELQVGPVRLTFLLYDEEEETAADGGAPVAAEVASAYRSLFEFSKRLMGRYSIPELLRELIDAVIEVTSAQKGFLLLMGEEGPQVTVSRNAEGQDLDDAAGMLSDSIVQRVIRERRPLIISDALHDSEFNASLSVISLRVCSVMCVPLLDRGTLVGLIYVGHDNVVSLFTPANLELLTVFAAQATLIIQNAMLVNELRADNALLTDLVQGRQFGEILGASEGMKDIFRRVERVAGADISVLITGETGTGKELIAREIHRRSSRAKGPFVTVNCGAIPENLLESELFGHVRGAFTGAVRDKRGHFHEAIGGTLLLDEIGELPLALQVKLLRALQEKTVTRVGANRPETVDIRVLAATNRDLENEIREGRFREDLYYRLNVVTLLLPPLRERGDDVLLLARYLLERYNKEFNRKIKGFTSDALIALRKYPWPGNIRQLENKIKKAVVLSDKPLLSPEELDLEPEFIQPVMTLVEAKEQFQRRYISEVLERNGGNRTKTAHELGVDPRTIFRFLEKEQGRS
ncbi:MAG: sigma 54-interacting transcriptional regulator [Myxococcota bacterium]|jgi:transcriptional regulator with GAF, ATPase, and Fis domain|nr:sigma 54-interacting transcriptional regulator [Myxococcota bacterium]